MQLRIKTLFPTIRRQFLVRVDVPFKNNSNQDFSKPRGHLPGLVPRRTRAYRSNQACEKGTSPLTACRARLGTRLPFCHEGAGFCSVCTPGSQAKKVDNYKCTFYTCVWKSLGRWWLWALKISNIDATSADSFVSSFSKLLDKFSSLLSTALRELQQSLHTGPSLCCVLKSDAFRELVSSVWKLCEWLLKPDEALFSLLTSWFFARACSVTHGFKSYP